MAAKRSVLASLLLLALGLHHAGAARAQGTGRSMDLPVSLRSSAMGGASNALFRGDELDHWGNPALLGYSEGIRYERSRTQLVPGLAEDVWFTTNVTKVGGRGLGFVFGGVPEGPDGVQLDYGTSEGTDPSGNPTGTFAAFERVRSWGFGLNLIELYDQFSRPGRTSPGASRYVDVSLGMNFKELEIGLAPGPGGGGKTDARDMGLLARITPVDRLLSGGPLPLRVDFSYGWSVLSFNDDAIVTFINEDQASPVTRHHRNGGALQLGIGCPGLEVDRLEGPLARSFVRGFLPLVSVSLTSDRASLGTLDVVDYKTSGHGYEISFANVFAIRRGHYEDRTGEIDGDTRGWRVGFPLGSFGGWMREEAWIPQAQNSGLDEVHRKAYAVWINPLEIVAVLRGHRGSI